MDLARVPTSKGWRESITGVCLRQRNRVCATCCGCCDSVEREGRWGIAGQRAAWAV